MHVLGAELVYDEADAIGFGERNTALSDRHSYLSIFESEQALIRVAIGVFVPARFSRWMNFMHLV